MIRPGGFPIRCILTAPIVLLIATAARGRAALLGENSRPRPAFGDGGAW